jgi:hypothetical protein
VESIANHDVRILQPHDQSVELSRFVLTIGVHLDRRAHRTANAHVEGERDNCCTGQLGHPRRGIRGSVIDDEDVGIGAVHPNPLDHSGDGRLFIPRGDRDQDP